jgi:hypothetical protein
LETAKELRAALDRTIAAAEFEEAAVRGQGRRTQPRSGSVTREMSESRGLRRWRWRWRLVKADANHFPAQIVNVD